MTDEHPVKVDRSERARVGEERAQLRAAREGADRQRPARRDYPVLDSEEILKNGVNLQEADNHC